MASRHVKVAIKVRGLIAREKNEGLASQWSIKDNTIKSNNKEYEMTFGECFKDNRRRLFLSLEKANIPKHSLIFSFHADHIFDDRKTTSDIFSTVAKPIVEAAVGGFNGTIFAYGQTSSGKVSRVSC